ncbi:MAG: hypothetical protein ACLU1U_06525 [Lachnospiraceae bacterium]
MTLEELERKSETESLTVEEVMEYQSLQNPCATFTENTERLPSTISKNIISVNC